MDSPSLFLEDWLRSLRSPPPPHSIPQRPSPPLSAPQIAQSWAQLRSCAQRGVLEPHHLTALSFLRDCGRSLHVAEPHVKLLIPVLSSVTCTNAQTLGEARSCAALLLSIWVRRSSTALQNNRATGKQFEEIMNLLVESIGKALEDPHNVQAFIGEAILLLGVLSAALQSREDLREKCQEVLARQCLERRRLVLQGRVEEALAGIGYAMQSSHGPRLVSITRAMISLWSSEIESQDVEHPPVKDVMMLLHLMEWCASGFRFRQQTGAIVNAQVIAEEFSQAVVINKTTSVKCAVVMGAAGFLRTLYTAVERVSGGPSNLRAEPSWQSIRRSLELLIASMADDAVQSQASMIQEKVTEKATELIKIGSMDSTPFGSISLLQHWLYETGLSQTTAANRSWLQCTALALARCKGFPSHPSILLCLTVTLLNDVIPIANLYTAQLRDSVYTSTNECRVEVPQHGKQGSKLYSVDEDFSVHVTGLLFQEVGAITRAMCEQYQSVSEPFQILIETILWEYSRVLYESHRLYLTLQHKVDFKKRPHVSFSLGDETFNKMSEAIFLFIVMFFSCTLKGRNSGEIINGRSFTVEQVAVLDSFSCVEFFRCVQVPEYGATVLDCVAKIASSEAAATSLLQMLPSYENVINLPGHACESYNWAQDEVQTARLLFYFRVLPSCLEKLSDESFVNGVAPLMFLYLQHPSQNLAEASHALFATFLSSRLESTMDLHSEGMGKCTLKEQLVPFYIQRALEVFPGVTPFEGLVSGVGAIVRHLPPGSPATLYCITCLAVKVSELYQGTAASDGKQLENHAAENRQGELRTKLATMDKEEAGKKILTLLVHLMLLVDLQILPSLLREVANLILGIHSRAKMAALGEIFDVVTDCDDFTRKLIVVPWLQTLSYLCTNSDAQRTRKTAQVSLPNESQHHKNMDTAGSEIIHNKAFKSSGSLNLNPSAGIQVCRTVRQLQPMTLFRSTL